MICVMVFDVLLFVCKSVFTVTVIYLYFSQRRLCGELIYGKWLYSQIWWNMLCSFRELLKNPTRNKESAGRTNPTNKQIHEYQRSLTYQQSKSEKGQVIMATQYICMDMIRCYQSADGQAVDEEAVDNDTLSRCQSPNASPASLPCLI